MAQEFTALLLDRFAWQLATCGETPALIGERVGWDAAEIDQAAGEIAGALREALLLGGPVALLLDSNLVLAAELSVSSIRQLRNPDAMLYELEEWLPVAAEDLSATYVRDDLQVLAMAVETDLPRQFATALEHQGIAIDLVMPQMPLAATTHVDRIPIGERHAVVWLRDSGSADWVVFQQGRPMRWQYLPDAATALASQLCYESLASPAKLPVYVYHNGSPPARQLDDRQVAELVEIPEEPLAHHALVALHAIRQNRGHPVASLEGISRASARRKHPLAREVRLLQLACVALLLAWTFVNWQAAQQSRQESEQLQVAAEDLFREVLPRATLRTGVRARLESELAKLAGVRGKSDGEDLAGSALPLLYDLLQSLPDEMRFRLLEIRIDDEDLHLTGEVRSFGDADRIAGGLRALGLSVTPPTTQRLPAQGVGFRLIAYRTPVNGTGKGENDGP